MAREWRFAVQAVGLLFGVGLAMGLASGTAAADDGSTSAHASTTHSSTGSAKPRASAASSASVSPSKRTATRVASARLSSRPEPALKSAVRVVGGLIVGLESALLNVAVGMPTVPSGSTVTVSRSSLVIPSGDGVTVDADWYVPHEAQAPTGLIYFQHGFLATGALYSYTAATLAQSTNSIVVAPTLSSNFFSTDGNWLGGAPMQRGVAELFTGDREALTASAQAAGYLDTLPEQVVLVGHSLGGGFVAGVAADMVDNGSVDDLAGVVLFDPVAMNGEVSRAATVLTSLPILAVTAPPYYWNQLGAASAALVAARPEQFTGVMLVGGTHIDSMQGGNALVAFSEALIAGFPLPQNTAAAQQLAAGWITDMLDGTTDGVYLQPGETADIGTAAGSATAIALPAPDSPISLVNVVLDAALKLLVGSFAVYEPAAAGSVATGGLALTAADAA